MDIVSILGLGAIGLGFLLAFLTYRLLSSERRNNTPIYVYQFFCFVLVLIGAGLQYSSANEGQEIENLQGKITELENKLVSTEEKLINAENQLTNTEDELRISESNLNGSEQKNLRLEETIESIQDNSGSLSNRLSTSQAKISSLESELKTLNNSLNAAEQREGRLNERLDSANAVMRTIVSKVPQAIQNLQEVNRVLTGTYCPGGSSGQPLWDNYGPKTAALSTQVMNSLTDVKGSIESILP